MKEGILNTIFIHMSRNVIGYLLEIISRIAHRNTDASLPDDGNIIAAIAESHGFIYVQTCRTCSSPSSFTSVRKISQSTPNPLAKIS